MIVTSVDVRKINDLISALPPELQPNALELSEKMRGARVVALDSLRPNVVTIDSAVTLRDIHSGEHHYLLLLLSPDDKRAGIDISVLEPLGLELLGSRVGDVIEWARTDGPRYLRVEAVQQPVGLRTAPSSYVSGDLVYA